MMNRGPKRGNRGRGYTNGYNGRNYNAVQQPIADTQPVTKQDDNESEECVCSTVPENVITLLAAYYVYKNRDVSAIVAPPTDTGFYRTLYCGVYCRGCKTKKNFLLTLNYKGRGGIVVSLTTPDDQDVDKICNMTSIPSHLSGKFDEVLECDGDTSGDYQITKSAIEAVYPSIKVTANTIKDEYTECVNICLKNYKQSRFGVKEYPTAKASKPVAVTARPPATKVVPPQVVQTPTQPIKLTRVEPQQPKEQQKSEEAKPWVPEQPRDTRLDINRSIFKRNHRKQYRKKAQHI